MNRRQHLISLGFFISLLNGTFADAQLTTTSLSKDGIILEACPGDKKVYIHRVRNQIAPSGPQKKDSTQLSFSTIRSLRIDESCRMTQACHAHLKHQVKIECLFKETDNGLAGLEGIRNLEDRDPLPIDLTQARDCLTKAEAVECHIPFAKNCRPRKYIKIPSTRLRASPENDGEIIDQLNFNTPVCHIGTLGDWYLIMDPEKYPRSGWVKKDFLLNQPESIKRLRQQLKSSQQKREDQILIAESIAQVTNQRSDWKTMLDLSQDSATEFQKLYLKVKMGKIEERYLQLTRGRVAVSAVVVSDPPWKLKQFKIPRSGIQNIPIAKRLKVEIGKAFQDLKGPGLIKIFAGNLRTLISIEVEGQNLELLFIDETKGGLTLRPQIRGQPEFDPPAELKSRSVMSIHDINNNDRIEIRVRNIATCDDEPCPLPVDELMELNELEFALFKSASS